MWVYKRNGRFLKYIPSRIASRLGCLEMEVCEKCRRYISYQKDDKVDESVSVASSEKWRKFCYQSNHQEGNRGETCREEATGEFREGGEKRKSCLQDGQGQYVTAVIIQSTSSPKTLTTKINFKK